MNMWFINDLTNFINNWGENQTVDLTWLNHSFVLMRIGLSSKCGRSIKDREFVRFIGWIMLDLAILNCEIHIIPEPDPSKL